LHVGLFAQDFLGLMRKEQKEETVEMNGATDRRSRRAAVTMKIHEQ
jgi:hypothetical protein